jgi:hypothetical protein
MIGDGNCYIATASARGYTPRVSVYGSLAVNGTEPCSNITCVGESTALDLAFRATRVYFQTTAGEPYFLRVGGDYSGIRGKFEFMVNVATCPTNDRCQQADPISPLPTLIRGDFVNATSEAYQYALFNPDSGYVEECFINPSSPTVWYEAQGTGDCLLLSIVGDGYYPRVTIFDDTGAGECGDGMSCVANSFYFSELVSWLSVVNHTYKIAVTGTASSDALNDFVVTLSSSNTSQCDRPVINDACSDATLITSFPSNFTINTNGASGEHFFPGACYEINPGLRGVWYKIVGTGSCYSVSAQNMEDLYDISPLVAVLTGSDCDNLSCTVATEYYSLVSVLGLSTKLNETYYILVGSRYGDVGKFSLKIEPIACSSNDQCQNATRVSAPFVDTKGSTLLSVPISVSNEAMDMCIDPRVKAAWYETVGNGKCLIASVAALEADFGIAVFRGHNASCTDMTCYLPHVVTGGGSTVSFPTEANVTYRFAVAASAASYGLTLSNFVFVLGETDECPTEPQNPSCASAMDINTTVLPYVAAGSTLFAPTAAGEVIAASDTCYFDSELAVWYKLTGTGNCYSISGAGSSFDNSIIIFRSYGACNNLQCVGRVDLYENAYQLSTEVGVEYLLRVGGRFGTAGSFELTIDEGSCPSNDKCSSSERLASSDMSVSGNTESALPFDSSLELTQCRLPGFTGMRVLWYEYIGDGSCVTVSLSGSGYPILDLYETNNGNCNDMQCIGRTRAYRSLTWQASNQTVYKIVVGADPSGNVDLAITSSRYCNQTIPTSGLSCDTAVELMDDDFPLAGTINNEQAIEDFSDNSQCYFIDEAKALWYRLDGDGLCYAITLSRSSGAADPVIGIFNGTNCESRTCIRQSLSYDVPSVGFHAALGGNYLVAVGGAYSSIGDMQFSMDPVACADNGSCEAALPVQDFPFTHVTSDIVAQQLDDTNDLVLNCLGVLSTTSPLWYSVVGDGSCLEVSAVSDEAQPFLAIMKGTSCENSMQCVVQQSGGSTFFWKTEVNTTYWLLVASHWEMPLGATISVVVRQADQCSRPPTPSICDNAVNVTSFPYETTLNLEDAADSDLFSSDCYFTELPAKTVKHEFVGDGKCLKIEAQTSAASFLYVLESEQGCNSSVCIQQTNLYEGSAAAVINLQTTMERVYYVVVGTSDDSYYADAGGGVVHMTLSVIECATNDSCENAEQLEGTMPMFVQGDTSFATTEPQTNETLFESCVVEAYSPGVWYEIIGRGTCLETTVIPHGSTTYFGCAIFLGGVDCDGMTCLIPYSGSQRPASRAWFGEQGAVYHIYVAGFNGAFTLLVTEESLCPDAPGNDACDTATVVNTTNLPYKDSQNLLLANDLSEYQINGLYGYGGSYSGSYGYLGESNATMGNLSLIEQGNCWQLTQDSRAVWYALEGDGSCVRVTLSTMAPEAIIVVFEQVLGCEHLSCTIQANEYGSTKFLVLQTEAGIQYKIVVTSAYSFGAFDVEFDNGTCAPNTRCISATKTRGPDFFAVESLNDATPSLDSYSLLQDCYSLNEQSKQLWYESVGDGNCWSASIAGNFQPQFLAVVAGDDCESLQCVFPASDNYYGYSYGASALVTWRAEHNITYRFAAGSSLAGTNGEFVFTLSVRTSIGLYVAK